LEHVTRISRAMVCEYGMSERLGTLALGNRHHNPFLGRDYADERNYSEEIAKVIDEEVHAIVEKCHSRATEILTNYREPLDAVVQALLERETLNREDFIAVMNGQTLEPLAKGTPAPKLQSPSREVERQPKPTTIPPRLEPGPA
ncbi:MAG: cell division protein FtsH, partial [Armatimonadota bacterium]